MAIIPTLRLTLSLFQFSDWLFFRKLHECLEVTRYMGNVASAKDTRLLFARRLVAQHTFVIREHNSPTLLSDIGLQISHFYPHEANFGYAIMPQVQGEGTTSEAVHAVCQYVFRHAGVTAINAYALADNEGSIRTLEETGFVRTQVLEKAYEINGTAYSDWVFQLECDALKL